jgi:hypothetical protein
MESLDGQSAVVVSSCCSGYGVSKIILYGGLLQEGVTARSVSVFDRLW